MANPLDESAFQGELRVLDLGRMRFVEIRGGASTVRRITGKETEAYCLIQLVLDGVMEFAIGSQRLTMSAGDLRLYGTPGGAEARIPEPSSVLAVCASR